MAVPIKRYFEFSLVQGVADAFVQQEVVTDLVPENGFVYKLESMSFNVTRLDLGTNVDREFSICRDTKTAVAKYNDPDLIYYRGEACDLTTSGAIYFPMSADVVFPDGLYVVEPSIFLQLDSTASGLANTMQGRLFYSEVKASEVEILRILNNS